MFDEITPEEARRLRELSTTVNSRKAKPIHYRALNGFQVGEIVEWYHSFGRSPTWRLGVIKSMSRDHVNVIDTSGLGHKQAKNKEWGFIRKVRNDPK